MGKLKWMSSTFDLAGRMGLRELVREDALYRAGIAVGKRLLQELQLEAAR